MHETFPQNMRSQGFLQPFHEVLVPLGLVTECMEWLLQVHYGAEGARRDYSFLKGLREFFLLILLVSTSKNVNKRPSHP